MCSDSEETSMLPEYTDHLPIHGSEIQPVISCTMSAVSGHPLYYVCSLWSSPVPCPQFLVIPCTVSAVSGHLLYCVRSLWSSPVLCLQSLVIPVLCPQSLVIPVLCPQSLVISCTVSAVSGHLLYCVRSLWSSPVLCLQSLVIPVLCTQSLVIPVLCPQ
ncbi:unnamed protein product, partial [Staurois parvus]